jgi:glycosyltransferase 2 family protein
MKNKRILVYAVVLAVLLALIYLQFRTWRNFDWGTFWSQTGQIREHKLDILSAIVLIYFTYCLRALRWRMFLHSLKDISFLRIVPPTFIGFSGLALLGRPGELIRPYLIARSEGLTFSSQMAVWAVERIFDIGAFTVLLTLAIFIPGTALHSLPKYSEIKIFGLLFVGLAATTSFVAVLAAKYGEAVSLWVERRLSHLAANLGHRISQRVREFHRGLDTVHGVRSFAEVSAVSIAMWSCIALSYLRVIRAYGSHLQGMTIAKILPLMGSSMVGSLIQLPGVGGGSQLATISTLQRVFNVPPELAASCGILLWLVMFMSVVPFGLLLAHRQQLSLRALSEESQQVEDGDSLL